VYCSLDRIDLTLRADDGTLIRAQTDHRTPAEVAATPELSVLFAIARIVNARRGAQSGSVRAAYFARLEPPPFLKQVLAQLGALLFVAERPLPLDASREPIEPTLAAALSTLAESARTERNLSLDREAVELLESEFNAAIQQAKGDEEIYWTRVVTLGALAGALIRARRGGRWMVSEQSGVVPFCLEITLPDGRAVPLDVMSRAAKSLSRDDSHSFTSSTGSSDAKSSLTALFDKVLASS